MNLEVLRWLEELESRVLRAPQVPLSGKVLLDEEALLDWVMDFKRHLPQEIEKARSVAERQDDILADAEREAQQIVADARRRAEELADETEITERARSRSEEIVDEAERVSLEMQRGAGAYVDEVLSQVEDELRQKLEEVRDNRRELQESLGEPASDIGETAADSPRPDGVAGGGRRAQGQGDGSGLAVPQDGRIQRPETGPPSGDASVDGQALSGDTEGGTSWGEAASTRESPPRGEPEA